jgi:hypothetical protein
VKLERDWVLENVIALLTLVVPLLIQLEKLQDVVVTSLVLQASDKQLKELMLDPLLQELLVEDKGNV